MPARTDLLDVATLTLSSGEGRRLEPEVGLDDLEFGGERYSVEPDRAPALLDVARMTSGYSFRLRFEVALHGACQRCLEDAALDVAVDGREVDQPGGGEELRSPYLSEGELDLGAWARDALVLALPVQILCRADCAGLCATCGENLNEAGPDHRHEVERDPRWAALDQWRDSAT